MAITPEQREQRRRFVGSSEIGALIGIDPYRNAGDVFLEKTGQLPDRTQTEVMTRGLQLEEFVLNMFEVEHGVKIERDIWVQGDEICAANLDGALMEQPHVIAPVEAKTSNFGRDWNRETGQIPLTVTVQAMFQIFCSGPQCTHAFVPALIPEFQRFKFLSPVPIVKRDEELIEQLVVEAHDFMDYVRRGVRPPDAPPHLESLKRIRREPDSVISLGDDAAELWTKFEAAKDKKRGAERDEEELKRQVLDLLGAEKDGLWCGVEAATLPDGRQIRFMEQNGPRRCDLDRLQILSPELYEQVTSQGKFRVLRIKKALRGKR